MKKNLVIINNEKCIKIDNNFFCENIEISSLSKSLSPFFNVYLFLRSAKFHPVHKIFLKKIYIYKNFYSFFLLKKLFKKNTTFLIISITPFTFACYLFLIFFNKRIFLYLRSHGDQEFRYILGEYSVYIYKILLFIMSLRTKLICVNNKITNKKFSLVYPSQLNNKWFLKRKFGINKKKINLLYFGRIKKEKGIYSLMNIFKNINLNMNFKIILNVVGAGDEVNIQLPSIKFKRPISKVSKIINLYDNNEILILPSFTEGHPQVMFEALARLKPVIIFDEIKHIKKNYYGVFISKRNSISLRKTILNIVDNYANIQSKIKLNTLPTHSNFVRKLARILIN
jgi:glycosyltransferase involved in cell wall biosynthesis